MNITIRKGTSSDLHLIENIEKEAFAEYQQSSRRALSLSLKSSHQQVWIAEDVSEEIAKTAGCLILYIFPHTLRIFSIAVLNAYKGKGIGKMMLKHAEKIAGEKGIKKISLELNKSNHSLLQWYEGAGFTIVQTLPDYYDNGIDGLRMTKKVRTT